MIKAREIEAVDIKEKICRQLLYGVDLSRAFKVLVSWYDEKITDILRQGVPNISIDYLMDMDFEAFIRRTNWTDDGCYDFVFDNGLLEMMHMDGVLLRALGMHMKYDGRLRAVFSADIASSLVGRLAYENNFDRDIFAGSVEAGKDSCYVVEFSDFQRKVTWLQSFYTPELRRELAFLLQRIDFDVQFDESIRALKVFLKRYNIDTEYLCFFVDASVVHKDKLYRLL